MSCPTYKLTKFLNSLTVCMKVFILVSILPSLIFKFKSFKEDTKGAIKKMMIPYFKSVAFLTVCAS